MPNKSICYVSGPMEGDPAYFEKFTKAEEHCSNLFDEVFTPIKTQTIMPNETYAKYLLVDMQLLTSATDIYMLRGWEASRGARAEHAFAFAIGLNIHYQN